jgi:hypothetical protein
MGQHDKEVAMLFQFTIKNQRLAPEHIPNEIHQKFKSSFSKQKADSDQGPVGATDVMGARA